MSRVGRVPCLLPDGVKVTLGESLLTVEGQKGRESVALTEFIRVYVKDRVITVEPSSTSQNSLQMWGTTRALIQNAVTGVSEGFVKTLEVVGVGYRAQVKGSVLALQLGFSHDVNHPIPEDVSIAVKGDRGQLISVSGSSKQRVGQVADDIRRYRPPEPYKGKGVRYVGELVRRKEGKKK